MSSRAFFGITKHRNLLLPNRSPSPLLSRLISNEFSTKPPSPSPSPSPSSSPIDAGSSIRRPISVWPGTYSSPVTNALWEARSTIFETSAAAGGSVAVKTPSQSRTAVAYGFSADHALREQYRNPWGDIRIGKLVEDLDALAGTVAFKHCSGEDGTTRPLLLVTASVDRILLARPISVSADLTLLGAVTWTGRSSIDIRLLVVQDPDLPRRSPPSLAANFTFVARDAATGESAPVNKISPETEEEKALWSEAEERKARRRRTATATATATTATAAERSGERLREMLAEGRVFGDMPALADRDSIVLRETRLENSFVCQPQQRNVHGRIFGGFLMRRAFELAFSTAYSFAGAAPIFVEVDHVDFLKPVDVGDFLRMKSCVLYTQLENPAEPLINVEVIAHVTRPELRSSEVSNRFYFTFTVSPEAVKDGLRIRNVVPSTEEEARRVLERMDAESSSQPS